MDVNTALIALMAVVLIVHHLRQRDCSDLVRYEATQARREESTRSKELMAYAFQVWMQAAQQAKRDGEKQDA